MTAPKSVIAFDVYGTIIDPVGMVEHLQRSFGAQARDASRLWRDKQIEFSFRRALMGKFVDFDVCTAQALTYVGKRMSVELEAYDRRALLKAYLNLPAFPDVLRGLLSLRDSGYACFALTNGVRKSVRTLLRNAGLLRYFEAIISADEIETFKPSPAIYEHLVKTVKMPKEKVWLVSGNAWDVIGADAYGLRTVWLQREPMDIFDPWEFSREITIPSLEKLIVELKKKSKRLRVSTGHRDRDASRGSTN